MRGTAGSRWIRAAVAALTVATALLLAPPAHAACHAFTVAVDPGTVTEGNDVTVTVSRDGGVGSSSVRVRTVDGSAKASKDYTALDETVSFMAGQTQRSFSLATLDDTLDEQNEALLLRLSDAQGGPGCNPQAFSTGPDAAVTIRDNDVSTPTSTPTKTKSPSPSPSPSKSKSPSPSPTIRPTASATRSVPASASPTATRSGIAAPDDEPAGGLSGGVVAAIVAGALVVGIATLILTRRRGARA